MGEFLESCSLSFAYTAIWFFKLQDGMALPDGPVVISPDGLFPSLYREGTLFMLTAACPVNFLASTHIEEF